MYVVLDRVQTQALKCTEICVYSQRKLFSCTSTLITKLNLNGVYILHLPTSEGSTAKQRKDPHYVLGITYHMRPHVHKNPACV